MRNAKPQCCHVSGQNLTGNQKFQGNNTYQKPKKSPEDKWFCLVDYEMYPYDLYDILSGSQEWQGLRLVIEKSEFDSLRRQSFLIWLWCATHPSQVLAERD